MYVCCLHTQLTHIHPKILFVHCTLYGPIIIGQFRNDVCLNINRNVRTKFSISTYTTVWVCKLPMWLAYERQVILVPDSTWNPILA